MTFTVKDKRTVTADGEWPFSMSAAYYNTGSKGSVTSKDTATLQVSGLEHVALDTIKVWMRSNKSAGAGTLTMTADGALFYTASGTYAEWFGAYNNTDFQPLVWQGTKVLRDGTLEIQLIGATNSLHIDRYEINYRMNVTPPNEVTLMRGDETVTTLTETANGQGVQLPALPDEGAWHFVAWTAEPFYQISTLPLSWIEPGTFVPQADCTLWAVYEYQMAESEAAVTELADGVYVYADPKTNRAMSGTVISGKAGTSTVNRFDPNQQYNVRFLEDGTATIQHVPSGEYIGFSGTNLSATASAWQVYHEGTKTVIYMMSNTKAYVLWPDKLQSGNEYNAQLLPTEDLTLSTTALLSTEPLMEEPVLTCYPAYGLGTEQVNKTTNEAFIIPFGIYELKIQNGQKYLRIRR